MPALAVFLVVYTIVLNKWAQNRKPKQPKELKLEDYENDFELFVSLLYEEEDTFISSCYNVTKEKKSSYRQICDTLAEGLESPTFYKKVIEEWPELKKDTFYALKMKYLEHDSKEHKYLREQALIYAEYNRRKYTAYLKVYPEAKTDLSEYLYNSKGSC
ncbi:hypothetical protein A2380_00940 [candidate division WWE3 bacterium RIFOXYB1_FULL_43_24]|nr:MAG: hypothetical protein A2380_00940 [candidate division WWE3 bacterium RIFOXYB1_FULL_43_24]